MSMYICVLKAFIDSCVMLIRKSGHFFVLVFFSLLYKKSQQTEKHKTTHL